MKRINQMALAAAAIMLIACSGGEAPDIKASKVTETANQTAEVSTPVKSTANSAARATRTKAVLVYADWCGSCKILDPKIKDVRAALGEHSKMPGLEFVTIDYTSKSHDILYAQADAAGVGEAVRRHHNGNVTTGVLLLVDMDDQRVIGTVTKDFSNLEIKSALKDAVAAS